MARTSLIAAGYVALSAADAALAGTPGTTARRLRFLTKPALMPTLNAAYRNAGPPDRTVLGGISAAQTLSWAGDLALLGTEERAFLAGLGSFFGAHVAYIATFLSRRGPARTVETAGPKAALALWLTTAPAMSLAARRKERVLGIPVAVYGTALAGMFAAATALDPALPRGARRALQAGAALFLVSDTLLGVQEFVLREEHPRVEAAVMATYTAGQGLIAVGAANL